MICIPGPKPKKHAPPSKAARAHNPTRTPAPTLGKRSAQRGRFAAASCRHSAAAAFPELTHDREQRVLSTGGVALQRRPNCMALVGSLIGRPTLSGNPNVTPARNSFTDWRFTQAWRKPTSKARLSRTCQMGPTSAEYVCPRPKTLSEYTSKTGRTVHLCGPSRMTSRSSSPCWSGVRSSRH
jgi:hypothetical protein